MFTITTPDGHELTAETDVLLASKLADVCYGESWADLNTPFDEHTIMNECLDALADIYGIYKNQ